MILKILQYCYWGSWILVYSWFDSCFMILTKWKLHFSLISSFYCCLVKEGWTLKVAQQFAMQGIVAYEPTPTPPSKPICQAIYLSPSQTNSPHLHQHIDKHLLNFTFCKSQTNEVSVALEPWRVESWSFQALVISFWHYLQVVKGWAESER